MEAKDGGKSDQNGQKSCYRGIVGPEIPFSPKSFIFKEIPMSLPAFFLPLQVEDQDLVATALAEYFGSNLGAGRLGHGSGVAGDCAHIAELDRFGFGIGNHTLRSEEHT